MSRFITDLRLFFEGARLSYTALFRWLRPPSYVASKILMPMNQLLFFTFLGIYATSRDNASFYVIGNALQITAISGIFGMAMSIGDDRFMGTLPYLFAVPSGRLFIFLGRAVFHVLDGTIGVLMSLLLGVLLFNLDLSQTDPLALLLIIMLTTLSTCGFGMMLGSISLITVNALFVGNVFYFVLLAFAGVNVPLDKMPEWVQLISDFLPLTRGLAAARQVIDGASLGDVSGLLLGEVAIGVFYTLFGFVVFRWIEFQARRLGTLETI